MLDNPIDAYLRVAEAKNRNRQQANQDLGSIGQTLGQGMGQIGQMVQAQKQKQLLDQLMMAMKSNGQIPQGPQMPTGPAIQGPQGYMPPGAGPSAVPAGQFPMPPKPQPIDNSNLINSLMMKLAPQEAIKANFERQDPYKQALTAQANAEAQKSLRPPKQSPEYQPYGISPQGTGLALDKFTGKAIDTGMKVSPTKDPNALDFKEQLRQDKLAKEYRDRVQRVVSTRSGGLGQQDQKVNQAIHLRSMVNQSWNPNTKTYELPEMQQGELVMGLANLVSGTNVSNLEQLRSITPRTSQGDAAHLISYWTGKPLTNQPQEMIKNLVTSIDRQGQISEKLRNKYISGLKGLVPSGLNREDADSISKSELSSSFEDILKESPDQGLTDGSGLTPQEQAEYDALNKRFGGSR